jgi:hypothetical protein
MFHKVGLSLQVDLKIQQRALRVKMYQRRQIVQSSHTVENIPMQHLKTSYGNVMKKSVVARMSLRSELPMQIK